MISLVHQITMAPLGTLSDGAMAAWLEKSIAFFLIKSPVAGHHNLRPSPSFTSLANLVEDIREAKLRTKDLRLPKRIPGFSARRAPVLAMNRHPVEADYQVSDLMPWIWPSNLGSVFFFLRGFFSWRSGLYNHKSRIWYSMRWGGCKWCATAHVASDIGQPWDAQQQHLGIPGRNPRGRFLQCLAKTSLWSGWWIMVVSSGWWWKKHQKSRQL